jgi:hypothetical protein
MVGHNFLSFWNLFLGWCSEQDAKFKKLSRPVSVFRRKLDGYLEPLNPGLSW